MDLWQYLNMSSYLTPTPDTQKFMELPVDQTSKIRAAEKVESVGGRGLESLGPPRQCEGFTGAVLTWGSHCLSPELFMFGTSFCKAKAD